MLILVLFCSIARISRQHADIDQARIQAQETAEPESLTAQNSESKLNGSTDGADLDSRPPLQLTTPLYQPSIIQHLLRSLVYGSTFTAAFFVYVLLVFSPIYCANAVGRADRVVLVGAIADYVGCCLGCTTMCECPLSCSRWTGRAVLQHGAQDNHGAALTRHPADLTVSIRVTWSHNTDNTGTFSSASFSDIHSVISSLRGTR